MAEVWIVIEYQWDSTEIVAVYDNEEAGLEHAALDYRYVAVRHFVKSRYEPS